MSRLVTATIHLQALRHNLQQVRRLVTPDVQVVSVIKADGYGHGLVTVAQALDQSDLYAVGCLDEALQLRQVQITKPILLLEGFEGEDELMAVAALQLQTVLHSEQQWQLLSGKRLSQPITVWLKVDSGMHRLGFDPARAEALYPLLQQHPSVQEVVLISHFANADRPENVMNRQQQNCFDQCCHTALARRSLCNSAATVSNPGAHHQLVRPGIMLYGTSPLQGRSAESLQLQPALTLQAPLIAIKRIEAGDSVGYGATWRTENETRLGVVAIGYGHGYPRKLPSGTPVLIRGMQVPLVGRVSMDMITVDLSELPEAQVGDMVTLWGEGLPVDEIAQHAGTISYELLCQLTSRVQRVAG